MLRELRIRFVLLAMGLLALVIAGGLFVSYRSVSNTYRGIVRDAIDEALDAEPGTWPEGVRHTTRESVVLPDVVTFTLRGTTTRDGFVVSTDYSDTGLDEDFVTGGVSQALASPNTHGLTRAGNMWGKRIDGDDFVVVFSGMSSVREALRSQIMASVAIFSLSMVALFLVTWEVSALAFRSTELAIEQQRQFVADASHELKTPLAVIRANLQILEREDVGLTEEGRVWLDRTNEEAMRMQQLIGSLLELARIDEDVAGGPHIDRSSPVELSRLAEKVALQFDAIAYERGLSIETDCGAGVMVPGNEQELEHLIMTLLDNACKYADAGTEVRVEVTVATTGALLRVRNHGDIARDIDPSRLFERFYRADASRTAGGEGGFGLGLAIAKSIVRAHGGHIRAFSHGDTTTFEVTLPSAAL